MAARLSLLAVRATAGLLLAVASASLTQAQPATPPTSMPTPPPPPPVPAPDIRTLPEEAPPPTVPPPHHEDPAVKGPKGDDGDAEKPASGQAAAKAVQPLPRPRRTQAILQAVDKVTAQTIRFPVDLNKPVRWKDLVFIVHACEESSPDEVGRGAFAHIEIDSEPKTPPGGAPPPARQLYRGWMFSEAPAAHPFEHPVYDVWLIACRTASPPA